MACANPSDLATAAAGSGIVPVGASHPEHGDRPQAIGRSDIRAQFIWYVLVGGLSFLADLAAFAALIALGIPVMPALVIGFAVGTLANYLLCRALAFTGGRFRRAGEIARLVGVALAGLALTAGLVAAFIALGLPAVLAKILSTPFALVWNYLGRRAFVFRAEMPHGTWRLSERAVARTRLQRTPRGDR